MEQTPAPQDASPSEIPLSEKIAEALPQVLFSAGFLLYFLCVFPWVMLILFILGWGIRMGYGELTENFEDFVSSFATFHRQIIDFMLQKRELPPFPVARWPEPDEERTAQADADESNPEAS